MEKTNGTADEDKAKALVIVNRANSGDKQYVQKGRDVNIHNVVRDTKQLQGYGSTNYNNFQTGSPRVSAPTRAVVGSAVDSVFKSGPTTNATFFIAKPGGAAPNAHTVQNLGNIKPANPARVGACTSMYYSRAALEHGGYTGHHVVDYGYETK